MRNFFWPSQKSWTLALVSFGWQSIIKNSELLETFKNIYWDSLMQLLSLNCTWLYFKYCSSIVKSFWHVYLICPIFLMHLIFCNALLQQFSLDGPWISLFYTDIGLLNFLMFHFNFVTSLPCLMPYPCSHFYFDIKFGNRLYSKEMGRAWPVLFWI